MSSVYFRVLSIALVLFIALSAVALYTDLVFSKYQAQAKTGSGKTVSFVSNDVNLQSFFDSVQENGSFIVSPALTDSGGSNTFMSNGLNAFVVVLTGNKKETIQLLRVFDSAGNLKECYSNFGDFNLSEAVSAGECQKTLSNANSKVILIDFPDAGLSSSVVTVSMNGIRIVPSNERNIPEISLLVLKAMFSNAVEIIDKTNSVGRIIGG